MKRPTLRHAAFAAGTGALLGAAAYGAERLGARRLRSRRDDGAADALQPLDFPSADLASHDGGTINYVDVPATSGDAVGTIVLSHGVTLSVRTWTYQLRELPQRGIRTIAFDHRGHGASKVGTGGHSVDNLADDFRSLLVELDLRDVVLVGHSMGGIGVQSFLARYPDVARERVKGVVLLSTLATTPVGSQGAQLNALVERVTRRTPDTTRIWATPNLGLLLARVGFGRDPKPSHVELTRQMLHDCDNATRRDAPRSLIGFDLRPALERIAVPTLIICGTHDVITPLAESRRMRARIPNARLEVVEGGGHMLMLERSAIVDDLITDFVREVAADEAATA